MTTHLMFKTADGVLHISLQAALEHLEERRGQILTSLGHRLAKVDKYSKIMEILEDPHTLVGMRLLVTIEEDKQITHGD